MTSLSIIIPTNDLLIQKEYQVRGYKSPTEQDTSLWMSTAYEVWGVLDVINDIRQRFDKEKLNPIQMENIKEGIRIIKEKVKFNFYYECLVNGLEYILNMRLQLISNMKEYIIFRMDYLQIRLINKDIGIPTIDKEKKEINKLTLEIKNTGASKHDLCEIGQKMKVVYKDISKYIIEYFE